ncbi:hypothetical protein MMYC01_201102 [Madurella mycetomatis]|uniref:Uncharacterized protein n=1 Tax=Madurella mycetomatis TaxID=100816 RepID=A0A175WG71_9PEZI|nr:hypothetical protein MMYC01_201102 [Madurella mycetomatis]
MHNLVSQSYSVSIADATGHEDLFSLAVSGFEFAKCPINIQEWSDDRVSTEYLPSLMEWLKWRFGCQDVFCYAYNGTCRARLQLYFPNSYDELMATRVRFINIWRPISSAPVLDCPLALCDFRTVDQDDLVPMDLVYPHFVDEAYEVRYNPSHRWFYKRGMENDDVIVFKLYDNLGSEATVCPHSAFVDPSVPLDTPRRASIEVKAIMIG